MTASITDSCLIRVQDLSASAVFNTNFGTGFNDTVSSVSQGLGFSNVFLGTMGTAGGVAWLSQ
jgi:hypothetical protein